MARHEKDGERLDPASFRTCATAYKSMVAILVNQQAARQRIFSRYRGRLLGRVCGPGLSHQAITALAVAELLESGYNTIDPVVATLRSVLQA